MYSRFWSAFRARSRAGWMGERAGAGRGRVRFEQTQTSGKSDDFISKTVSFFQKNPIIWVPIGGGAVYYFFFRKKPESNPANSKAPPAGASNPAPPPGGSISTGTKVLETGTSMLQSFEPLKNIHSALYGFYFYNGEPTRQVEGYHLCARLNEDFQQCTIYDSDKKDARLIGVEYIISERLFNQLPESERRLWHSHQYEVKSGCIVAPNVPELAERQLMKDVVSTYGKTWQLWQVDRGDVLPVGGPRLMMSFTQDGQLKPELVDNRDKRLGVSADSLRKSRSGLPDNAILEGADSWQQGQTVQCKLDYV